MSDVVQQQRRRYEPRRDSSDVRSCPLIQYRTRLERNVVSPAPEGAVFRWGSGGGFAKGGEGDHWPEREHTRI